MLITILLVSILTNNMYVHRFLVPKFHAFVRSDLSL